MPTQRKWGGKPTYSGYRPVTHCRSGYANRRVSHYGIPLTKWSKTVEIANIYMKGFEDVEKDLESAAKTDVADGAAWRRFWNLQREQYFLWKKGPIDKTLYEIWMHYKFEECKENRTIGGIG